MPKARTTSRSERRGKLVVRLFLVDDEPVVREGLKASLERYGPFKVVGEAGGVEEALAKIHRRPVDLVVLDMESEDRHGPETARSVAELGRFARVVLYGTADEASAARQAVLAGAQGYVSKRSPMKEVARAIAAVARGEPYFGLEMARSLLEELRGEGRSVRAETLTPREIEVLRWIAEGLRNRDIAARLGISIRTVETHRERIMEKLGIRTVAGLTRYAVAKGLVSASLPPSLETPSRPEGVDARRTGGRR